MRIGTKINPKVRSVDWLLLLLLIVIVQGDFVVKIIGFLLLCLTLPIYLNFKITKIHLFYATILIYSLGSGLFYALRNTGYYTVYIMVIFSWTYCLLTSLLVYSRLNKASTQKILATINIFFVINVSVILLQYFDATIEYSTINPFAASPAAGDLFRSIYANSSISMMVFSFFSLFFFLRREYVKGIIAIACMLSSTYMAGIVLFIASIVLVSFFVLKISFVKKVVTLLSVLMIGFIFTLISPRNYSYAAGYIERIVTNTNVPFKIVAYWQTFSAWLESVPSFLFGYGPGNFSSRAAFIASGDYVDWLPKNLIYKASIFSANHLGLWNYDFNNPFDNRNNTANQPFSFYNQIIGEYGIIGILLFIIFYSFFIYENRKKITYGKYMFIALLSYFILDYWFEYFAMVVVFELFIFWDIKNAKEKALSIPSR